MTSKSARALREAEDLYGIDDTSLSWRVVTQVKGEEKGERRSGQGATVFFAVAVVLMLLALSQLPSAAPSAQTISPMPNKNTSDSRSAFGRLLGSLLQTGASSTLHEDFRAGFVDWEGLRSSGSDWRAADGEVRPTSLRLWTPSTGLSNYELEFMGQIERKGMDWAFRAPDLHNYYATKLVIARPGVVPNAGLIRYIVLDGRERERVELPLPLTLERGMDYRVRVSVRGDRFLTWVNGQLISSWVDNRLSRGGVGFFSEDGESALLKWVTVSERDSVLARIASHFSLITFPTAAMADRP